MRWRGSKPLVGWALVCAMACSAAKEPPAVENWPAPPPDSELAQITAGMSQQQVMQILGPPTEITNASRMAGARDETAKAPARTYYVYDGLGEVVFSSGAGGATAAVGVYSIPSSAHAP